jgi:23S rRNA (uracil1939-C5)-methyltransferase
VQKTTKKCKKLIGVEIVPEAVEDAKINAKINGTENARFICADAAEAAKTLEDEGIKPDTVILDPPRKGCDKALLETVVKMDPERIVYVSCDPATLARDLAILEENGYKTQTAIPFDLFPRTVHIECCALLCRTQHSSI